MIYWASPDARNSRIVKGELVGNADQSCRNLRTGQANAGTVELNAQGIYLFFLMRENKHVTGTSI